MHRTYEDIRSRLGEPLWHDDQGVPRYEPFSPELMGVYDDVVTHFVIRCASCGDEMEVARSSSVMGRVTHRLIENESDALHAAHYLLDYRDTPWHRQEPCAGVAMLSDTVKILGVYWKVSPGEWRKLDHSRLEVSE